MSKIGAAAGARFSGALTAALAPAAIVETIRQVTSSIAEMSGEAEMAGVSFEAFQELRYSTEKSKVSVDALTDGLKEMNLRADEFIETGKGPAAEAFARLGIAATDLKEGLSKPDELFETIIGRLEQLDRASQIRISDEIFGGTGGEQFVKLLDEGVESIRRGRQEARDFGLVLSDDIAEKAADIDRQFQLITQQIGTGMKTAIVTVAGELQALIDKFREIDNKSAGVLEKRLQSLGLERLEVENEILELRNRETQMTDRSAKRRETQIRKLEARMAAIAAEEKRIMAILKDRDDTGSTKETDTSQSFTPLSPPGSDTANSYEREVQSIKDRTAAIAAEAVALANLNPLVEDYGRAVATAQAEQDLLSAAMQAGVEITPELEAQIRALADAYGVTEAEANKAAEAQDQVRRSAEELRDVGRDALSGVISDLRDGKSAADIMSNALDKLIDRLQEMALDNLFNGNGNGKGGGLFGALAGLLNFSGGGGGGDPWAGLRIGANANGTKNWRGGLSWVGERGPELVNLPRGAQVYPNDVSEAMMSGRGGNSTVRIELGEGLEARMLEKSAGQTFEIVRASQPATVEAGASRAISKIARGEADEVMNARYGVRRAKTGVGG
ncbi:hypothetical protein [Oricola sp.]|uniref:hypothetical protein n=1 Tax=Oricola sp. TaxID=1979950 RepID=UPI0025E8275D|nr:hypothetical protein [Oricola sp.]MCI5078247.1 hypothetical protein [Oricola sp.]